MEKTCLFFSEGKRDHNFLNALCDLPKFKFHTKKWFISTDHASGEAPQEILSQCKRSILGKTFTLVMCFIDIDKLMSDHEDNWETEKTRLEQEYSNIVIIWQVNNAEEEFKKVLGDQYNSKHKINKAAKEKIHKFINSDFWKRILKPIKDMENNEINDKN